MAAPSRQSGRKRNSFNGRFRKDRTTPKPEENIIIDHNYDIGHVCEGEHGCEVCCPGVARLAKSKKISIGGWKTGRRVVELDVLVKGLGACEKCKLGPLYLSESTIKGEMKLGLGGYLYISCTNCSLINRVPYGKTHRSEGKGKRGMPSFCVNTKIGTGKFLWLFLCSFSRTFHEKSVYTVTHDNT